MSELQEGSTPRVESVADVPVLPARMVNEFTYCPRLAYLEWVQGEWAESADTVEGRYAHRRVDKPSGSLPSADASVGSDTFHARSVMLSSARLGLVAKKVRSPRKPNGWRLPSTTRR